ncbi:methyl-accepting chemotaxis protein [uncultured Tateyamaria sp.]|uniref:methyl-accepting chemotaxis protein n=1 Tax=uncultured Tateyamaria sp. TaxID=455651 RepID=UPI002626C4CD|nr:methyl-accepting chemotaxis protein [uncultured Tateyamaria sp.]
MTLTQDVMSALDASRLRAARWLLNGCLVLGVCIAVTGLLMPANSIVPALIALGATAVGYWSVRVEYPQYRLIVGQVAVAQPIALLVAMSGSTWQMDAHMLFFVALSALVGLVDIRAIIFAAITTVLHHLSLGIFLPHLVFPTVDFLENVERVLFHGAIVGLQVVVLAWAVRIRISLTKQVQRALTDAKAATVRAEQSGALAETAHTAAQSETARAQGAQSKAEALLTQLKEEQTAREKADSAARATEAHAAEVRQTVLDDQSRVVTALRDGLSRVARGDLASPITEPFPDAYEVLRSDYNAAIQNLASALSDVAANTGTLMEQVAGVSASANDLSERTDKQVASLDATGVAIENLHKTVQASTENARATASAAIAVKTDAVAGGDVVRRVIAAMSDIESSSQEIAKINAVMDGIAFQTNLLALNAGVEAARAGEAGRGFSVVASEVRALSQRATEAARGINDLTERSGRQVQDGVALVGQAGKALDGIVDSIANMTAAVERIAQAAENQSDGLRAVNDTVNDLDAVAHSNATMFEETTAACHALTAGMEHISDRLRGFELQHDNTSVPLTDDEGADTEPAQMSRTA